MNQDGPSLNIGLFSIVTTATNVACFWLDYNCFGEILPKN